VSNDANSGIFIRCEDPKKPGAKTCYECNIYDTRPDPSYGTGAIVYHAEVNPMPKAGGKWSTMEITVKGRDLSITFDGKQTASVRSGRHTEGPFALQFGEGTIKFRKVAIKPLYLRARGLLARFLSSCGTGAASAAASRLTIAGSIAKALA